jgi:hypothetical protein
VKKPQSPPPQVFVRKNGRTQARAETMSNGPHANRSKLRVTRDAHKRKGYTRADGTKVAPAKVHKTTYLAKDTGKPGRSSYGAKAGPHSEKKGFRPWITTEGSLGSGFLTTMSSSDRKRAIDRAVKVHGYRIVLGKISALQRSSTLRTKYGKALDEAHEYLVRRYGGPGSFGSRQSNFGATIGERQDSRLARLKR